MYFVRPCHDLVEFFCSLVDSDPIVHHVLVHDECVLEFAKVDTFFLLDKMHLGRVHSSVVKGYDHTVWKV